MKLIASVALLAVTALGHATDLIALTDQEFDAQFVCPEAMTNNEDRQAAVHATILWAQAQHKDWTVDQFVAYRVALLERHKCEVTLQHMRESAGQ